MSTEVPTREDSNFDKLQSLIKETQRISQLTTQIFKKLKGRNRKKEGFFNSYKFTKNKPEAKPVESNNESNNTDIEKSWMLTLKEAGKAASVVTRLPERLKAQSKEGITALIHTLFGIGILYINDMETLITDLKMYEELPPKEVDNTLLELQRIRVSTWKNLKNLKELRGFSRFYKKDPDYSPETAQDLFLNLRKALSSAQKQHKYLSGLIEEEKRIKTEQEQNKERSEKKKETKPAEGILEWRRQIEKLSAFMGHVEGKAFKVEGKYYKYEELAPNYQEALKKEYMKMDLIRQDLDETIALQNEVAEEETENPTYDRVPRIKTKNRKRVLPKTKKEALTTLPIILLSSSKLNKRVYTHLKNQGYSPKLMKQYTLLRKCKVVGIHWKSLPENPKLPDFLAQVEASGLSDNLTDKTLFGPVKRFKSHFYCLGLPKVSASFNLRFSDWGFQ